MGEGPHGVRPLPLPGPPPPGMFAARVHLPFVATALLLALFGGLTLAIALPVEQALRDHATAGWTTRAQLHGHLQAVGFVGLFIVGVAYRLVPGFAARPLAFPRLVPASFWLLAGGVAARTIAQPLADAGPFAALLAAGVWAEAAGVGCFALSITVTAWPAARRGDATVLFVLAGTLWFTVQAALGAGWLSALAAERGTLLAPDRDAVLVLLQVFGVHLSFILGVGLRAFPVFFGAPRPARRWLLAAVVLVEGGVAAAALAALLRVGSARAPWALADAGLIAAGAGLIVAATLTGGWRSPSRLRPLSRPVARAIQAAIAWMAVAGVLLAGFGGRALLRGADMPWDELDATRHVVEIGVVLMTMVGMAQLVLPEFAGERLVARPAAWRGATFAAALSLAALLRAGARLFAADLPGEAVDWMMATAGVLALAALAAFALLFARAARGYGRVLVVAAARATEARASHEQEGGRR